MKSVIQVLQERDGLSLDEAKQRYKMGMRLVMDAVYSGRHQEAEDIFMSEFGLEPDYLIDALM